VNSISCAKIILRDESGKILVLRRGKTHPKYPLFLDLPGGEVEPGEVIEQALSREIKEETGLSVGPSAMQLLHAYRRA
jgi:8-oxo-dGTP diphosphatase